MTDPYRNPEHIAPIIERFLKIFDRVEKEAEWAMKHQEAAT